MNRYEESHDNMISGDPRITGDPYRFQEVQMSRHPSVAALDLSSSHADSRPCDALPVNSGYGDGDSRQIARNFGRRFSRAGMQRVSSPDSPLDGSSPGSSASTYSEWVPVTASAPSSLARTTPTTFPVTPHATTTANTTTTTTTLLIIVLLIFLTMIILIIVLCRLGELQKTADFIVNHQQTLMHGSYYAQ